MNPTFHIKGDESDPERVHISLTRGLRKETHFTRAEFGALVSALSKDYDILSQIGPGCELGIEIDVDVDSRRRDLHRKVLSHVLIQGVRPLVVTKTEFFSIIRSPRIAQRALYWSRRGKPFIKIFREGGRGCSLLIDTQSVEEFYFSLREDKISLPLMPGETGELKEIDDSSVQ